MSTVIRPEVSDKNKYWIERQRYYELKHFCLQYGWWKHMLLYLDGLKSKPVEKIGSGTGDPTAWIGIERAGYAKKIDIVEKAAMDTDPVIGAYILKGVTCGLSYDTLNAQVKVPCCKDIYYDLYRRFFWILDQLRE